jgi:hypothetical protein
LRVAISSMPIAVGPGVPARSIWARMYCISSALTVSQVSFSSLPTSRIEACRRRRPTQNAKRLVKCGLSVRKSSRSRFTVPQLRHATHLEFQDDPKPGARKVANPSHGLVVPARLLQPTAAAGGFFGHRSSVTIRTSRSPIIPRTAACAREPRNECPSDSRRCPLPDRAMLHHAGFPGASKSRDVNVHACFRRYDPPKSPTRLTEDPLFKAIAERVIMPHNAARCANCGVLTPIDLPDAKPSRLAGPSGDPSLRRRGLADALLAKDDCDRLECQACYGPGWVTTRRGFLVTAETQTITRRQAVYIVRLP